MAPTDSAEVLERFHSELDLVDLAAKQISRRLPRTFTLDDLTSFGREGLLHAARSFNPAMGVPFRRWANLRVKGSIIDGVRRQGPLPRRLYQELRGVEAGDAVLSAYEDEDEMKRLGLTDAADDRLTTYLAGVATAIAVGTLVRAPRENVDANGKEVTPEDLVATAEIAALVKGIVGRLPDQERALVEAHYFGGRTLDEAAASIGLSKSWGSRLHARAIDAIGAELRKAGVE